MDPNRRNVAPIREAGGLGLTCEPAISLGYDGLRCRWVSSFRLVTGVDGTDYKSTAKKDPGEQKSILIVGSAEPVDISPHYTRIVRSFAHPLKPANGPAWSGRKTHRREPGITPVTQKFRSEFRLKDSPLGIGCPKWCSNAAT